MLASYFSPLAPAVTLLLGAFILSIVFPRLPDRRELPYFVPPVLVGLAAVALLGTRLTFGPDPAGEGLELLSGWNFSTVESVAALTVRVDALGLAFLLLTLLILLAVTLAYEPRPSSGATNSLPISGWLAMGAVTCFLFASGNGLTLSYTVFLFDLFSMLYWLNRGQINLSVGRLFLGVFTAAGLALVTLDGNFGPFLFGLGLWLRLGVYPLIETSAQIDESDYGALTYLAMSLAVGLYLLVRSVVEPLPQFIYWLTAMTMLLSGLSVWLAKERPVLLSRLVITEALLVILGAPLAKELAGAYAIGLILSLVALWITPRLGKPNLNERAWLWPYLPAVGATLTISGIPFSLGWPAHPVIYQSLFASGQFMIVILAVLAEGGALSGLVRYWVRVWQGQKRVGRQAAAAVVIMVPFLIPGLAPFILTGLTQTELPATTLEQPMATFIAIAAIVLVAFSLAFFRRQILNRFTVSPATLTGLNDQSRFWGQESINWVSKMILRVEVFLQGQHYIGWALFTALVGVLIVLLGT